MTRLKRIAEIISVDEMTDEDVISLGEEIGIDWEEVEFSPSDLKEGMLVELEHGSKNTDTNITDDDPLMTAKIALVHLLENSKYYTLLKKHVEG